MPGFDALPQAIPPGKAYAPILPEDVRHESDPWDDATALGILIADVDSGLAFNQAKNFTVRMETADDLIRGYVRVRPWPNTDKARSALSMPLSLETIERMMPKLWLSIWGSGKDPFEVTAKGKTSPEVARAWQSLLRWAVRESDFREGTRLTLKSILQYGYGCGFDGWESSEIESRKYVKTASGTVKRDRKAAKKRIQKPTYDNANLRNTIFDPACYSHNPNTGRWVARRMVINGYVLDEMRQDKTYRNVPTREELAFILANKNEPAHDSMQAMKPNQTREYQSIDDKLPTSKDPLAAPIELIEYRTRERIVTAIQRAIVVRNEENESGELGVHGCSYIDVLNSLYGFGAPQLLSGEQRLQQGIINTWSDSLSLQLNPSFQMTKGVGSTGQNISIAPGRVITTEAELKPLIVPDLGETAINAIEASQMRANRRVGAEGGPNMPTQAMRTGSGVQAFQADFTERAQYFMEQFLDLVFIPVLKSFLVHCSENLQPDQIQQILDDEDGKQFQGEILDIYNADVDIEIIAGVKLATKQAASQIVPIVLQTLQNQAVQSSLQVQGIKFDYKTFVKEWFDLMGWDTNEFFVPMTPADFQRVKEQNQAMQNAQGDLLKIQNQHNADLDLVDQKAAAQGQLAVMKSLVKTHEAAGMAVLEGEQNGLAATGPGTA
jgi:hypothetical protein